MSPFFIQQVKETLNPQHPPPPHYHHYCGHCARLRMRGGEDEVRVRMRNEAENVTLHT